MTAAAINARSNWARTTHRSPPAPEGAREMTHREFTLTVAECEGGWQVLVNGDADVFRTVETREQAEAMAAKWHELTYQAPQRRKEQEQ